MSNNVWNVSGAPLTVQTTGTTTTWSMQGQAGAGGNVAGSGGGGSNTWANPNVTYTYQVPNYITSDAGKVVLQGEKADLVIAGMSLKATLETIQQRLNILSPNPELEAQWDQLRELGEAYRRLEDELQQKQKMWDTLKQMPPPDTP
jgi:hypothetical protein